MDVEVELSRIIINETSDQQIIVLKERNGKRAFPIIIGIVEIFAIDRRLKGIKPPRPMTHDLLSSILDGVGAELYKVVITSLKNNTYYALIYLKSIGNEIIVIDARPSDSIIMALKTKSDVFLTDDIPTF